MLHVYEAVACAGKKRLVLVHDSSKDRMPENIRELWMLLDWFHLRGHSISVVNPMELTLAGSMSLYRLFDVVLEFYGSSQVDHLCHNLDGAPCN